MFPFVMMSGVPGLPLCTALHPLTALQAGRAVLRVLEVWSLSLETGRLSTLQSDNSDQAASICKTCVFPSIRQHLLT